MRDGTLILHYVAYYRPFWQIFVDMARVLGRKPRTIKKQKTSKIVRKRLRRRRVGKAGNGLAINSGRSITLPYYFRVLRQGTEALACLSLSPARTMCALVAMHSAPTSHSSPLKETIAPTADRSRRCGGGSDNRRGGPRQGSRCSSETRRRLPGRRNGIAT